MYHDQGHIPIKLSGFDEGVNVTLGLPFPRSSVDHGTAFDIAGRGVARWQSMAAAIRVGALLARQDARPAQAASRRSASLTPRRPPRRSHE